MPEKELIQMTNDLIADRLATLKKQQEEAAKLPNKEESVVTRNLIAEKMWLEEQKKKVTELSRRNRLPLLTISSLSA